MKRCLCIYFLVFLFSIAVFSEKAYAQSSYVLPYPSAMPGSFSYKLHLAWENLMEYWYFGNFGQFSYNLKQADKYLVEAKTLFEYKQYLLAYKALQKSDDYFIKTYLYLRKAKNESKNINQKQNLLKEASLKHKEKLNEIKPNIPENFVWQPEKAALVNLELRKKIEESIGIRTREL